MKKRLLYEVSMDELRHYREAGLSNSEIAELLDVTAETIWRHLGPCHRSKGRRSVCADGMTIAPAPVPDVKLTMEFMVIKLSGEHGAEYEIVYQDGKMKVTIPGQAALIPDVSFMIAELSRVKELANMQLAAAFNEKLLADA